MEVPDQHVLLSFANILQNAIGKRFKTPIILGYTVTSFNDDEIQVDVDYQNARGKSCKGTARFSVKLEPVKGAKAALLVGGSTDD